MGSQDIIPTQGKTEYALTHVDELDGSMIVEDARRHTDEVG